MRTTTKTTYGMPDYEYTDRITIEVDDIESKDVPQALFALKEALKMPELQFKPMEMPQLPSLEVPKISLPKPKEDQYAIEHQDHPGNVVPPNRQRKAYRE